VPEAPRAGARWAFAVGAVFAALLCLDVARNWDRAGAIAERVVAQAAEIPGDGPLAVVTLPDSYRSARVFTNSFDVALRRAGARREVTWCVPVHVRNERPSIRLRVVGGLSQVTAETDWDAPFDFPVLRDPGPLVPGCSYAKTDSPETAPGLRLSAEATIDSSFRGALVAFFNGRHLRLLRGLGRAE
jgi:hypothetical protein